MLLEAWGLTELAEVALAMHRPDIVDTCIRRSLALLDPDKKWYGLPGRLEIVRGRFAADNHGWDEADGHFERAIAVTRAFELPYDEARAHHAAALAISAARGPREAASRPPWPSGAPKCSSARSAPSATSKR